MKKQFIFLISCIITISVYSQDIKNDSHNSRFIEVVENYYKKNGLSLKREIFKIHPFSFNNEDKVTHLLVNYKDVFLENYSVESFVTLFSLENNQINKEFHTYVEHIDEVLKGEIIKLNNEKFLMVSLFYGMARYLDFALYRFNKLSKLETSFIFPGLTRSRFLAKDNRLLVESGFLIQEVKINDNDSLVLEKIIPTIHENNTSNTLRISDCNEIEVEEEFNVYYNNMLIEEKDLPLRVNVGSYVEVYSTCEEASLKKFLISGCCDFESGRLLIPKIRFNEVGKCDITLEGFDSIVRISVIVENKEI